MKERIKKLRKLMSENDIEAFLVTGIDNRRYLSGFSGSRGWLLILKKRKAFLLTDGRYWEQAEKESPDFDLVKISTGIKDSIFMSLSDLLSRQKFRGTLGFEGEHITFASYRKLRKYVRGHKLTETSGIVEKLRAVKDSEEINLVRKSVSLNDRVFRKILKELKPGITEKEISAKIHYYIESSGGESPSFPSIVAFGPSSAMPHYTPGTRKLKKNDIILIDMGSVFHGYCSDMTRTILFGDVPEKARKIYRIVEKAQKMAISAIRPGVKCSEIDRIARKIIEDAGYGEYFSHNLGHSIGMAVHEPPSFSPGDHTILKAGMLLTVEPGIYLTGFGGVRIEDLI
ncbi:MAG: aminopeptidase P family protein, partial [Candidatus Eremiobacteraeota bacterium]|nr:aminopeptidase P family protein [Candidatus Eremiobacteraeota bacterium]